MSELDYEIYGDGVGQNPARAAASALSSSPDALGQLWLLWVAPLVGATLAGLKFRGFALLTPAAVPAPGSADTGHS